MTLTAHLASSVPVGGIELLVAGFLSPELASRAQFGWTISVHILFAALSISIEYIS